MAPTQQQAKTSKAQQLSGKKTTNARVQRYLRSTESQLREGPKSVLLFKGIRSSDAMNHCLQDLRALAAPHAKLLSKKNQIVPFDHDGQHSLEFLTTKNDCALFAMATHNKKRPHHLVIGRTFDRHMLDMAELQVLKFKSMKDYGGTVPKKRVGSKPLMLFVGDAWQQDANHRSLQNLLVDFYRGDVVDKLVVSGLDHLIVFTAVPSNTAAAGQERILVHQRTYFLKLKRDPNNASSKTPVPLLLPCGPDLDFQLKRTQWAEPDLYKAARKKPTGLKKKKVKNQSTNLFGETLGRLHLTKQNVESMQSRKSKALRRAEKMAAQEEQAALEEELEQEKEEIGREFQQTFGFEQE